MERRTLLKLAGASAALMGQAADTAARAAAGVGNFELSGATVAELAAAMESGARTCASITHAYLARIDAVDRAGPALRSVIETNPDALAVAEALDRERKDKGTRGPLHGVPVLVKDNIGTADRMRTSAGSLALAEHSAARDAFIVERLRAAGCVILGKTNLSEWANFRSSRSTSGWSARGGQTRNPYALDRSTSGSSSGTGAAVAADLCAVGVGTETDGSIVSPSSACGLVGIKPTVGLLGRSGIIPISHSQDTPGPMARTVADAALVLGAMAGVDPSDPATRSSAGRAAVDYTRYLRADALAGARIGVARDFFGRNDRVDRIVEEALAAMRGAGAIIVDEVKIPGAGKLGAAEYEVLLYEFKADLDDYLAGLGPQAPVHSLADLIVYNARNAALEMPYFAQERFVQAQAKGPLTDAAYRRALATCKRVAGRDGIDAALAKYKLDALCAPTGPIAWLIDYPLGDHADGGCSQFPAVAGYPHITVPAGFAFDLPVGVSFFAGAYSEGKLIALGYAFEQATNARRPPQFKPSIAFPR